MSAVLLDFGIKVITEEAAKVIKSLEFLYTPGEGYVAFLNDTDGGITVETFDQNDAVRWVSYERRRIAPHQVVELNARGQRIHIRVKESGYMYDCIKGTAYLYNGQNVYPKVS